MPHQFEEIVPTVRNRNIVVLAYSARTACTTQGYRDRGAWRHHRKVHVAFIHGAMFQALTHYFRIGYKHPHTETIIHACVTYDEAVKCSNEARHLGEGSPRPVLLVDQDFHDIHRRHFDPPHCKYGKTFPDWLEAGLDLFAVGIGCGLETFLGQGLS